jgi:hypothetical protein
MTGAGFGRPEAMHTSMACSLAPESASRLASTVNVFRSQVAFRMTHVLRDAVEYSGEIKKELEIFIPLGNDRATSVELRTGPQLVCVHHGLISRFLVPVSNGITASLVQIRH